MSPWKTTQVDAVAVLVSGGTPPRNDPRYWGGQIPWITCKDMKADRLGDSSERLTESGLEAGSRLVPTGAVLIVIRGMILARDVPVAIATRPVAFNQDLKALLPKPSIDGEFLLYALKSKTRDLQQMTARAAHGTKSLLTSNIAGLEIPFPPLTEQRKIAAVLSAVQRAIERQERLIARTAELKKALMHKLFTEGTRGERRKQSEIGLVPNSWRVVRLDQIAAIERGKFAHRPRNAPEFYGGGIPFVQTGDVSRCDGRIRHYTQTLNERGLAISKMFPRGTILITIAANIGYTGILEFDSACTDSLVAITPTQGDSAEFLNHYLQTQQPVMDRLAPQGTQKNINIQFLKPWPIPRPPAEEQLVIGDTLHRVDLKRRNHEQMRDSLVSLFRTLLHQLMTAQVRVHDLDLSALEAAGAASRREAVP